jgi:hypothetical protein
MRHRLLLGLAAAAGVAAAAVAVVYYKDISLIGQPKEKTDYPVDPTKPRRISAWLGEKLRFPRF